MDRSTNPSHSTAVPLVSVLMPVYNGLPYLNEAVESILGQEDVDLELICVDDGSTDGSLAAVRKYAERDRRVRVITQDRGGVTSALINGCRAARGEYLARQDSDDVSLAGRLREQLAYLKANNSIVAVGSWIDHVGPGREYLYTLRFPADAGELSCLIAERKLAPRHGTLMIRRSAYDKVGGYRLAFRFAQDWDLLLRLVEIGQVGCLPQVAYLFREHTESTTAQYANQKQRYVDLGIAAQRARQACGSDDAVIGAAVDAVATQTTPSTQAEQLASRRLYEIGRKLWINNDVRCEVYLRQTIKSRVCTVRAALLLAAAKVRLFPWWRRARPVMWSLPHYQPHPVPGRLTESAGRPR